MVTGDADGEVSSYAVRRAPVQDKSHNLHCYYRSLETLLTPPATILSAYDKGGGPSVSSHHGDLHLLE